MLHVDFFSFHLFELDGRDCLLLSVQCLQCFAHHPLIPDSVADVEVVTPKRQTDFVLFRLSDNIRLRGIIALPYLG